MNEWNGVHTLAEWLTAGFIFLVVTVAVALWLRLVTWVEKRVK